MIRVYDSNEKIFATNGIKTLNPLKADITKVDNGDYYIELKDVIANIDYYQKGMIFRVQTPWGVQGFRCDNPKIKNNKIECKAWHLSYDSENYIIKDAYAVDKNCNDALNYFNDNTDVKSPFKVASDIVRINSTRVIRKSLFEVFSLLIGDDKYGGHWHRDNFNFIIRNSIGEDRGVVLASNKNITDMQVSEDWDEVCTKILPYTTVNLVNEDGEIIDLHKHLKAAYDDKFFDLSFTAKEEEIIEVDAEDEE